MRFFVCLFDPSGNGIAAPTRHSYEVLPRSRGLDFRWEWVGNVPVLIAGDDGGGGEEALVVCDNDDVAVGMVRLDNRADLERWAECPGEGKCDLELVLRTVMRHGTKYVPQFLGEFGFVVWSAATRTIVAACDTFALRKLYYVERGGLVAFASRAEAVALDNCYDGQHLAELVGTCRLSPERSVYANIRPVQAANMVVFERGRVTTRQYWSPNDFQPDPALARSEHETTAICRTLFAEAVALRLRGTQNAWAQLSGGIDSSAVVCMAQWLAERGTIASGLSGTVSYVDRQSTLADEREYSEAVVRRWPLRNETIVEPPIWFDEQCALPRTDQPRFTLYLYPRERRLCAIVRASGGRVLLTGVAGDSLFTGTMLFFADELAKGRIRPAIRDMLRRAAIGRVSFWELAYRNALLPLLPTAVRNRLLGADCELPTWLRPSAVRRYGLRAHGFVASTYAGRIGSKYHHAIATNIAAQGTSGEFGVLGEELDVRHPFLYRPLVEFALRLPPGLSTRPHARKWLLREAMRGILPDAVRTRVGKGGPGELFSSSFTTHRALLEPLLQDPILAELGVIDGAALRAAFYTAPQRPQARSQWHGLMLSTLMIEAWLQMRSGRWPHGGHRSAVKQS